MNALTPAANLAYVRGVARVQKVAEGAVSNDLASAAAGQTTIATVSANDTGSGLSSQVAAATTSPTIIPPANITVAATSASGAAVDFGVSAFDLAGESLTPTLSAASGAAFPIGSTTVTATATDAIGDATSTTFTITVADTTPPTITLPANLVVQANTTGGADVTLPAATATDPVDPKPKVTESLASGFFPLGTTTVTVTATDAAGNVSTGTFNVTVQDTTAPVLTVPSNLVVEANTRGGATVALPPATAVDVADPEPAVTEDQSSGFFALGTTTVHVTATDASGNVSTKSFTVTVQDTTAPRILLPPKLVIEANASGGANVTLPTVTAADIADLSPKVTEDHSSGFFPLGTTTIDVMATDASGNTSKASYTITVQDTTPPTINLPANMVVEANAKGGANVTLPTVIATDVADPKPKVTEDQSSGFFRLGVTLVHVAATDASGNVSTAIYTVTVHDTTAPVLTLPANLVIEANTTRGADVTLPQATAVDVADPSPVVSEDQSSGFFALGVTTVHVTAVERLGERQHGVVHPDRQGHDPARARRAAEPGGPGDPAGRRGRRDAAAGDGVRRGRPEPRDQVLAGFRDLTRGDDNRQRHGDGCFGQRRHGELHGQRVQHRAADDHGPREPGRRGYLGYRRQRHAPGGDGDRPGQHDPELFAAFRLLPHRHHAGDRDGRRRRRQPEPLHLHGHGPAGGHEALPHRQGTYLVDLPPDGDLHRLADLRRRRRHPRRRDGEPGGRQQRQRGGGHRHIRGRRGDDGGRQPGAGTHSLFAAYLGDATNGPSQSSAVSQVVAKRALMIEAVPNTKGYDGTTDAAALPVVVGLQGTDAVSGLGESYATAAIGTGIALTPVGTVADAGNYNITYVGSNAGVITPALIVTPAAGQSMVYGSDVPAILASFSGFLNGDTASIVTGHPGTKATAVSDAGHYAFTLSTLFANGDYTLELAANAPTFTVEQATPVIALNGPVNIPYGTPLANGQLSGTASWTVNGVAVTVPGTFGYTTAAGTILNSGNGQSESVTFTPAPAYRNDYATATTTVMVNVVRLRSRRRRLRSRRRRLRSRRRRLRSRRRRLRSRRRRLRSQSRT